MTAATTQTDTHREHIIRLVDTAPTLTAAQADIIRAVLGGVPATRA